MRRTTIAAADQFYSPQLVRSLSETSATSTSGSNSGPAGNAIARPSGSGGVPTAVGDAGIAAAASSASNLALTGILAVLEPKIFAAAWAAGAIPGIIVTAAFGLFDIFDAIFGGGDSAPPTPRQLLHGRHPLYPVILGCSARSDPKPRVLREARTLRRPLYLPYQASRGR